MATLREQIADVDAQIATFNNRIADARASAAAWRAQANKTCTGTKNAKASCEADKKMKAEKAASYDAAVVDFQKSITQLEQTKKALQNLVDAEATAQVKLAEQGKDVESLRVEADGAAKAAQIVAEGQGQAALRSAEIEATAKAESSKNNVIWIILGVLVLAAIIFVVVRKIRKKSKTSK